MPGRLFILCIVLVFPFSDCAANPERDTLEFFKSKYPVVFDGKCDEAAWDSAGSLPMRMYQPVHGNAGSERSDVFVTFDDEYLYLAGRLYYESGTKIIATSKKRDAFDPGNDYFGILLDTYNDNENALCFQTSPEGIRSDFAMSNDGIQPLQGPPFNQNWNTFWDVKTMIERNVWHVEIRIPLSSLRFQDVNRKVIMGMTVWRFISDKQELDLYPLVSNKLGSFSPWKPSQARKIVLHDMERKNPVYATPYLLTGLEQNSTRNADNNAYQRNDKFRHTAGLDLKYALTSNLTMDLTLNTDFAQVESDDQIVNVTRFDVFYPEKRQFFLERSSLFEIKSGFFDQLFYSRRIGLYEGELVPVYGGIRAIGRTGGWDLGILDMQTGGIDYYDEDNDSTYTVQPANNGILRFRRQVFNPRSYMGGVLTSKTDVKGNYNLNAGLDGVINLFGNDYLSYNYVQTFDNRLDGNVHPWDNGKVFVDWNKRTDVGFGYEFTLSRAGQNFLPELGFEMFEDYTSAFAEFRYGWVNNDENKRLLKHSLGVWSWMQKRNQGFNTDLFMITPYWSFESKTGYAGRFFLFNRYENPVDTFKLSDTEYFAPGKYKYLLFEGMVETPGNKFLSVRSGWDLGTYYDGYILGLGPAQVTARISSSVQLSLDYQYNRVVVPDRDQLFESHLVRLKSEFTFTTKWSLLTFLQYSSDEYFGVNNVRLRYNPKEGNDLYLVYNEGYNTFRDREFPMLPFSDTRSILLKYTYTFIFNK